MTYDVTRGMAFLRRMRRSRYWYAQFCVPKADGSWRAITRSTKIEVQPRDGSSARKARADAQLVADKWEYAAKSGVREKQIRKVMVELAQEVAGLNVEIPTVKDWFEQQVMAIAKEGLRPATIRNYRDAQKKLFAFLGKKVDWTVDRITTKDMNEFKSWLLDRIGVVTVNKVLELVKRIFADGVRLHVFDENPCDPVKPAKLANADKGRKAKRAFTVEELRRVLAVADEEMRSMTLVALYTGGQRLGDVANLCWDAVDFDRNEIRFRTMKTGREMAVPMIGVLRSFLLERRRVVQGDWLHPENHALYELRGSAPVSRNFMFVLFQAGLISSNPLRAGVKRKDRLPSDVSRKRQRNSLSFHSLRYTATTVLHAAGVPFALVQEIVGHDSSDVHEGYISKFGERSVTEALEKLPVIE